MKKRYIISVIVATMLTLNVYPSVNAGAVKKVISKPTAVKAKPTTKPTAKPVAKKPVKLTAQQIIDKALGKAKDGTIKTYKGKKYIYAAKIKHWALVKVTAQVTVDQALGKAKDGAIKVYKGKKYIYVAKYNKWAPYTVKKYGNNSAVLNKYVNHPGVSKNVTVKQPTVNQSMPTPTPNTYGLGAKAYIFKINGQNVTVSINVTKDTSNLTPKEKAFVIQTDKNTAYRKAVDQYLAKKYKGAKLKDGTIVNVNGKKYEYVAIVKQWAEVGNGSGGKVVQIPGGTLGKQVMQ